MSKTFADKVKELNPWIEPDMDSAAPGMSTLRDAAQQSLSSAGHALWNRWAAEMIDLKRRAVSEENARLVALAANVDLSAWPAPSDFAGLAFPGDVRISGRKALDSLSFDSASIAGDLTLESLGVENGVSLQAAQIGGDLVVADCRFGGRNDFAYLKLRGALSVSRTTFTGGAWHQNAAFDGESAWTDVDFMSDAAFHRATFGGPAHFRRVNFYDTTGFEHSRFAAKGVSEDVSFYKKCFVAGAEGELPDFLRAQIKAAASGQKSAKVARLTPRSGRKDAG